MEESLLDDIDTGGVVDVDDFDNLVHGAVEDLEVVEDEKLDRFPGCGSAYR